MAYTADHLEHVYTYRTDYTLAIHIVYFDLGTNHSITSCEEQIMVTTIDYNIFLLSPFVDLYILVTLLCPP